VVTGTIRTARILAVGSELLTPHRIDTNSLFLTSRLNELGVVVRGKAIVGDDRSDLATSLRDAMASADVVILTGGLGPTADDITRDVVADVLGRELAENSDILDRIRARFKRRGVPMPEINRRQSMVPSGAVILPNPHGTAPGLWLEAQGVPVILLPGPPREMKPMVENEVMPRLAARTGARRLLTRVLKTTGRSESQIEEVAFPVYSKLGTSECPVETTILASAGQIELHLSAAGDEPDTLARILDAGVRQLQDALGAVVFSTDGRQLERVVGDLLRDQRLTIAVAESCTGGLMLGRLTDIAGSSAWVVGGVVAYANAVKIGQLGVASDVIESHGAVSEAVAMAMAEGVRSRLRADVGVGITGIAGPGGATPQKPVGTVVIAVAHRETVVQAHAFPGDREAVRRHATSAALDLVRRSLTAAGP
jgi:nicotinamide-nucleotide amidase